MKICILMTTVLGCLLSYAAASPVQTSPSTERRLHSSNGTILYSGPRSSTSGKLLHKRAPPAVVYYDQFGNVKVLFNWILNYALCELFENSGYDLAKDIMSSMKDYMMSIANMDQIEYIIKSDFSAEFDYVSRYLNQVSGTVQYATLAVVAVVDSEYGASQVATLMQSWFGQGEDPVTIKYLGAQNALGVGGSPSHKRSLDMPTATEKGPANRTSEDAAATSTNWCNAPVGNTYDTGQNQEATQPYKTLYWSTTC